MDLKIYAKTIEAEATEQIYRMAKSEAYSGWKSPVCVTPEAQVPLTLESKFRMTPIKS